MKELIKLTSRGHKRCTAINIEGGQCHKSAILGGLCYEHLPGKNTLTGELEKENQEKRSKEWLK